MAAQNGEAGGKLPLRNEKIKVTARAGCQLGTRCPAPLTVTNVSPLYCTTYPPTYDKENSVMQQTKY